MPNKPYLSFIVPVFNEVDNVEKLHSELVVVAEQLKKPYEIIFVDDGSRDGTSEKLATLSPITIITMRKNFGQTAALDAGIKHAQGEYLVTLDGDGQNDPVDVPKMLEKMELENWDVVCGWRKNRHDDTSKRFVSAGARWLRSFLIRDAIHDSGCTLRVYHHECFDDVNLRGEMHRFIPALLIWRGFQVTEMVVNHRARSHGVSKYNSKRMLKGFLDMLSLWFFRKFASRPLHLLGALGLGMFALGILIGCWMFVEKVFFNQGISDRIWPLAAVFLMLFGMQMFVSGLIMDLIISSGKNSLYVVKSVSTQ